MHKYRVVIYWSDEDDVFIAEVPELPGCITHGDTQAAALANASQAVQGWIDTANHFGDPIPQPTADGAVSGRVSKFKRKAVGEGNRFSGRRNSLRALFTLKEQRPRRNPKAH
jgi:predicted RNase H-like HicB family nuclease